MGIGILAGTVHEKHRCPLSARFGNRRVGIKGHTINIPDPGALKGDFLEERKIYEGKAKILFDRGDPRTLVQHFKDDATAFNAQKKGSIPHKGAINCQISAHLFKYLDGKNIPTHFVDRPTPVDMTIRRLTMIPLEVVMRNQVAGSLSKRLGLPEGTSLPRPVLEWYYKRDDLGDPLVNGDHIGILGLASTDTLSTVEQISRKTNDILRGMMASKGIILVDMKLEFGLDAENNVILGDEISPDTCRFWDEKTGEKMDKDRFRRDLGQIEEHYLALFRRVVEHDPEF
uniref:Phosphoribosylaminoimidazole-succinocarboxamide synthase n=1 Tax=Leptospirillum ferriphilum TaxID=178606 RepID=A0A7C3LV70_9BACT